MIFSLLYEYRGIRMKKIALSVLLMLVSSVALFAASDKAQVVSFTGKAEYQTSQDEWLPLSVGAILDQGTVISTGFKSSVVLTVGESRFTVAALSRITISKLIENDSNYDTEMNLATGKLKMNVKSKPGKTTAFTVRSPTATASVRGTSGIMSSDGNLQSITGTWSSMASNGTKEVKVSGTQSTQITSATVISSPQQTNVIASTISQASTSSLAAQEAVATAGSTGTTTAQPLSSSTVTASAPAAPTTGTITVTISLPNSN